MRDALVPLRRYLAHERPDGIQALMWPLTVICVLAHWLARSNARLVLADHTTLSRHYAHFSSLRRRLMGMTIRLFYPLASARVAVSSGAADDLARVSGIARSSIDVIYNPVPESAAPSQDCANASTLWGGDGPRLLTVGNLKAEKNQALLIRAFARKFRGGSARLAILGEGQMRKDLEALAAVQGIARQVLMPGFVEDPGPWYDSAQLFVLSSDYEGYPLVLVEAMHRGLTVVSTDCENGPREILDGGRCGILVPAGDETALAEALERGLRSPFSAGGVRAQAAALSSGDPLRTYFELMVPGRIETP
jgi:glycosyltransferase involved in cell wall biosynthesis